MPQFDTTPIPYVEIGTQAAAVRTAIDAARLSAANSFGGLQKLAIPGPFATDAEANTFGVPDDNLYYRSDGTVRAASHISLDLAFALDKTLTARTGPTPTFSRASSGLFTNANGILVGKTTGTTTSITPSSTANGTSVTVTVASGSVVGWLVGQSVSLIVDTDGGNDNDASELWLVGTIVSTTATQLVFTVTEKTSTAGSQTAWTLGYRGARFDHDATGASKGLLIEEPRTNLLRESQALDSSTFWIGAGATVTVTPNNQISPDGLQNAETLTIASSLAGGLYQSVTCTANTVYTFSFYVKLGTFLASNFLIAVRDDVGNAFIAENIAPSVTPVTGEWRRITYTFTTPTNCTTVRPYVYRNNLPTASGTVFIWGAQLEAGASPTSYIPTTIGTAARSADVCSIEGTAFSSFYNPSEGTLYVEVYSESKSSATGSPSFFSASDGTVDNSLAIIRSSASDNAAAPVNSSGAAQFNSNIITNAFQSGGLKKLALAYKTNDLAFSAMGSSPLLDALATIPANLTIAAIGSWPANSRHANSHIARITVYRKRFSNAKLQTITT